MVLRKPVKKIYLVLSIIVVFITGAYVFYRTKKHDILENKVPEIVKKKTHDLYNVTYDSLSVNEVAGNLDLKNIHVKGDTVEQLQMIANKDTNAAKSLFDIYVPAVQVVGFKTVKALLAKQMECKEIIIKNPIVKVYVFPGVASQKDSKQSQQEIYKQLLGKFKLIKADHVSIQNARVITADFYTKEVKFTTINTSINLSQLAIDSTYNQDTTRTLFCKEISITSDKVILGEKKNTAEIIKANFDTRSKILAIGSISYDAFKNNGFFKTLLSNISITGVEWKGPVENSEVIIDKAVIKKGELESLLNEDKESKSSPKKEPKILTGWIKNFSLNSFEIKSINYTSRTNKTREKPIVVKNNSFLIRKIKIDRSAAFTSNLINQAKEIELNNDEISIYSADRMYQYKIAGIKVNTGNKMISIKAFKIVPQFAEEIFAKKAKVQRDRYDFNIKDINCKNVTIEKLVKGELEIQTVTTQGSTLKIFRDLGYPADTISKHGSQMSYPQQILHKLSIPLKIDKFISSNTYVEYKEKNAISKNSGRVRFDNAEVVISNITNHKAKPKEKMTATLKTMFLETIPVTGAFTFSLDRWQKGSFTAEASVAKSFDATMLNQLTQPMAMMKIEKGIINSVHFYMDADTNTSNTTLVLPYNDIKISMLKKDESQYNKKAILSLLANIYIRNNNNEGEKMRTGKVVIRRNKYRSFFNFIWTSMFSGIRNVATLKL